MEERGKRAVELFFSGCNCCQAVAAVFCRDYGIPEETVLRIASTFGGGMRRKEVCGAVTGALMVLGMLYGPDRRENTEAKEAANGKTIAFMAEFERRHGSYLCRDLLKDAYWKDVCGDYVAGAVSLLEEFGT